MVFPDVRPYALEYLNQWHEFDRCCRNELQEDADLDILAAKFRELATKYVVAWNFSTSSKTSDDDSTHRLWKKVAKAVCEVEIDDPKSIADEVEKLAIKLGKIVASHSAGKRTQPILLSAATKFLWFRGYDAIRIYDKNAVNALNEMLKNDAQKKGKKKWKINGDYKAYLAAWEDEYRKIEGTIKRASNDLGAVIDWSRVPHGKDRKVALAATKKQWFRERVFDRLLWEYKPANT